MCKIVTLLKRKKEKSKLQNLWHFIGEKFYQDIPNFGTIWNEVVEISGSRFDNHPNSILRKYFQSLTDSCQQVLYALEKLKYYATQEASNIYQFYVSNYLYDLLTRIKTSTDIMALIINHIYQLNIPDKKCSLEKRGLSTKLRKSIPTNNKAIASIIDKANNDWLSAFYEFRNIVIHKAGLQYVISGISNVRESLILLGGGDFLKVTSEKEILDSFLKKMGDTHINGHPYLVDPLKLSRNLWKELAKLIQELLNECYPQIKLFMYSNK
jgi:hypothetical protein